MKRTLIVICLLFAFGGVYNSANAQTGKETLQACINAMKIDKMVDSFKTLSMKTYMYQAGQKIIFKIYQKETADRESIMRFEQSVNGKEEAYVYSEPDDEFFKVVPQYEELNPELAGKFSELISMQFPQLAIHSMYKDTTGNITADLLGTEEFEGKKCKKIGVSIKTDSTATAEQPKYGQYFYTDEVSNFLYGMEMPEAKLKFVMENMKKIKGVVYPAIVKVLVDGKKTFELEIDDFEVNIELKDSLFSKPS